MPASVGRIDILRAVSLFVETPSETLAEVAALLDDITAKAGETIIEKGAPGDCLYILVEGRVRAHDGDRILNDLGPGDVFGEMAVLDPEPRSASVTAVDDSHLFRLSREPLDHLMDARPEVAHGIIRILVQRLRGRIRDMAEDFQIIQQTTERLFKEELARQALRSEMEIERHRAMSQMVAGVAHEINTPLGTANTALSIIKGELTSPTFAALMQDRKLKQSIDDMLEAAVLMERNIQRAHKLTQDFKKISVSQLTDTKETMNLPEAVAEIVGLYKASAKRARLDLQIENTLPPETQTWLGYRGYLSHILLNFLTNVERYAYPRGVGGKVAITLAADGSRDVPVYVLTVRDFGQGIPPENVPKLFEPFFTTGRILGGSGLGLSIVRNMVTGPLQGTVEVASAVGQGTTFTVAFPQRIVDQTGG